MREPDSAFSSHGRNPEIPTGPPGLLLRLLKFQWSWLPDGWPFKSKSKLQVDQQSLGQAGSGSWSMRPVRVTIWLSQQQGSPRPDGAEQEWPRGVETADFSGKCQQYVYREDQIMHSSAAQWGPDEAPGAPIFTDFLNEKIKMKIFVKAS